MGPQNALIGDYTVELPEAALEEDTLIDEKKMARYSKSKEFKRVAQYCQERIAFYQDYLPNGQDVGSGTVTAEDWKVANRVIMEFKLLIDMHETAAQAVKDANAVSASR